MKRFFCLCLLFLYSKIYGQLNDYDGNKYDFSKIGSQVWMNSNLMTSHFNDGTLIHEAKTDEEWLTYCSKSEPCWAYYNFDEKNRNLGKLYNGYAVFNEKQLTPNGWRIPCSNDWSNLDDYINDTTDNYINKLNEHGFSLKLGGSIYSYVEDSVFEFRGIDQNIAYWSSDSIVNNYSDSIFLSAVFPIIFSGIPISMAFYGIFSDFSEGYYVRAIKGNDGLSECLSKSEEFNNNYRQTMNEAMESLRFAGIRLDIEFAIHADYSQREWYKFLNCQSYWNETREIEVSIPKELDNENLELMAICTFMSFNDWETNPLAQAIKDKWKYTDYTSFMEYDNYEYAEYNGIWYQRTNKNEAWQLVQECGLCFLLEKKLELELSVINGSEDIMDLKDLDFFEQEDDKKE